MLDARLHRHVAREFACALDDDERNASGHFLGQLGHLAMRAGADGTRRAVFEENDGRSMRARQQFVKLSGVGHGREVGYLFRSLRHY
jgi:hypothetical protein